MTTDNIMSDTTKDAVPVAWFYYEDGEFIRMYDSEDRAEAAREKFGGDVEPVYKHPARVQAEPALVPEGWKLVPIEPTDAMCAAMEGKILKGWMDTMVWRAALDAAPAPSTGDQS